MTTLRTAALAALVVASIGCSMAVGETETESPSLAAGTIVEVTNNNWLDAVVYVVRLGVQQRLGTVNSMTSRRLEVPSPLVRHGADLRFEVHPIGTTQSMITDPIAVAPGQRVRFTIQNHLAVSDFTIWE